MISKSKLFLWLMLLFLAGVALRSFVSINNFYLLAGFGIAAIFCFGWLNRRAAFVSLSLTFAFLFGVFWFGFFDLKELDKIELSNSTNLFFTQNKNTIEELLVN